MAGDLLKSIRDLSRERGISEEVFFSAIKDALLTVAKKYFDEKEDVNVVIDKDKGEIKVFTTKIVVKEVENPTVEISLKDAIKIDPKVIQGDEIKLYLSGETLGRIAAQTAKNIISHKVVRAEQEIVYEKYKPLTHTLISGEIRRVEKDNLIVGLDIGEAIIPAKELSPKDKFVRGDHLKFYIKRVFPDGKGPLILGTRYMNDFVKELIKKEVPEVEDGIVEIKAITREPGVKTKIAVVSNEKNVDPVGAIVGMNGNRVLTITKELKGERIDVVAWSDKPERFIASALTPGVVISVNLKDERNKIAEVTVTSETLSSAIGKKGVNIKLASRLTKWTIQLENKPEF